MLYLLAIGTECNWMRLSIDGNQLLALIEGKSLLLLIGVWYM